MFSIHRKCMELILMYFTSVRVKLFFQRSVLQNPSTETWHSSERVQKSSRRATEKADWGISGDAGQSPYLKRVHGSDSHLQKETVNLHSWPISKEKREMVTSEYIHLQSLKSDRRGIDGSANKKHSEFIFNKPVFTTIFISLVYVSWELWSSDKFSTNS